MHDYIKALQERFDSPSQRANRLEKKVAKARRQLAGKLSRPERKLLLRLTDLEDELRDEAKLDSFIAGFRLAQGIQQELNPPYSLGNENEQKASELAGREVAT